MGRREYRELRATLLRAVRAGRIFPTDDSGLWDLFCGSFSRFVLIASRLRGRRRVLDCGAGQGMLCAMLSFLGHEVCAVDLRAENELLARHSIPIETVNLECEPLPFASQSFDAVVCCQVLEHFVHSHLPAVREFHRVLRPGGICEIDVPNVASFRNRSRLLRGKNIAWDYEQHYLDAKPVTYQGREVYPDRHNREFTAAELSLLFARAGFRDVSVEHISSLRYRTGFELLKSVGSVVRDLVPGFRKTLLGTGIR